MDATAIQGEDEKSLEGNEQQLCSWEGRQLALGPLLRKPRCVRMRTLELICWSVLQPTSSHPRKFPFHATTLKSAPPNLPTTQAEMGSHDSYHANQEGFEKEKGHNYGRLVTPGRPASAGSVLGAGSGGGDTGSRGEAQ